MVKLRSDQHRWHSCWRISSPVVLEIQSLPPAVDPAPGEPQFATHRLIVQDGNSGAVGLVVRNDTVAVVRQFRPATGRWMWEFPRGMAESADDSSTSTAVREVLEETGWECCNPRKIGTIWPDSGILGNDVAVVTMEAARQILNTDCEISDVRWLTPEQITQEIRAGVINDGISLAAWAQYQATL